MVSQHLPTLAARRLLAAPVPVPAWKRTLDLFCCLAAFPVLGGVTFVYGVVLATMSKGPLFFWQDGIGYRGHRFRLYRFRTMPMHEPTRPAGDAVRAGHPSGDGHVPGGRVVRFLGLADLPQIVNVLRGEMSIVGPRPRTEGSHEHRWPNTPRSMRTLPGCTGLWRVARRDISELDEARLDAVYAEHRSLWLDLRIIFQTVGALSSRGYRVGRSVSHPSRIQFTALH